jgi:hypothetical protein
MKSRVAYSISAVAGLLIAAAFCTTVQAQQRPQRTPSGPRTTTPPEARPAPAAGSRLTRSAPRSVTFTPEREAAALAFVQQNRPELVGVLADLKTRKPTEYQRAICDFFWTSETLATMRQEEPRRHDLALRTWQLEALMHLLASQLAGQSPAADGLRAELELAVRQLVDVQIETSAYDVERQETQLRRSQERQKKLAARRDELVRERLTALSEAIERSGSSADTTRTNP